MKKENLDPLLDLKDTIEAFTDSTEKAEWKAKFDKIVPKETAAYLEKKEKAEQRAAKLLKMKEAIEAKAAERQEKKRKALEENAATAATAVATAATAGGTATATTTTDDDTGEPNEDVEEVMKDPYWDFKLKINGSEIIPQTSPAAQTVRSAKKQNKDQIGACIQKTIMGFNGNKAVRVQYQLPGSLWKAGFTCRYANALSAFQNFGSSTEDCQRIAEACISGKDNTTITKQVGHVVLAIMLHNTAKHEKDYPLLGLHPGFHEPNFLIDLKNTKTVWLPLFLNGSPIAMHGLYELVCSNELMHGTGKDARTKLLFDYINEKGTMTVDKAKQVEEIISILQSVVAEIEGGAIGEKEMPIDPFDTRSELGAGKKVA